ncbi:CoA-binding protein [Haloferax sp. Atlit-6N]|uniref:YneT family protein n=1 Tax=Haloferax gibbonsii TaxID=35746 RepID=A0A871BF40_HALGI|nr:MULTISPECIES: CoA-binding protein [Haloferax]QOS11598.1 YneT family protein [Haloferax gibbonsii]RDZ55366.1 CoA-binding protein [Haloferax sp. Atlit-4N]REA04983.1 CoA-binding protein [Haloferax sp. Atlit-6N]
MPITSDDDIRGLFDAETIAVVGCSATPGKPAHDVPAYMQRHGYRVVPVNPFHDEILGETAYDSLADVDEKIDLVDVFRPSEEAGDIVDAAIERADARGDVAAVWLQLGISDDDAAARAEEAGLSFVQDRCFKVEHSRLA